MNNINNQKGITLFELLLTITITSVVLTMLMGLLTMVLTAKADLEYDNRLLNESYYISEYLQNQTFQFEPQYVQFTDNGSTQEIKLYHYEISADPDTGELEWDNTSEEVLLILFNKGSDQIFFDGEVVHPGSVKLVGQSNIVFTPIGATTSFTDINGITINGYENVVIELTLEIEITLPNGSILDTQTFTTTIII